MDEDRRAQIERWVSEGKDLSRGNFTNEHLVNAWLKDGHFYKADFTGTNLRYATFDDADCREAIFRDADLGEVNFQGTDCTGADFTGASLRDADIKDANFTDCIGLIDAGIDDREYRFIGVKQADGSWRIKAGCRWFAFHQAYRHWQDKDNQDAIARVDDILLEANRRD